MSVDDPRAGDLLRDAADREDQAARSMSSMALARVVETSQCMAAGLREQARIHDSMTSVETAMSALCSERASLMRQLGDIYDAEQRKIDGD